MTVVGMVRLTAIAGALAWCAGCTVGPDYVRTKRDIARRLAQAADGVHPELGEPLARLGPDAAQGARAEES